MSRGKTGAYRVVNNRLMHGGEELLSGPLFQLEQFAAVLSAAKPRDPDIGPTLRALIGMTRDCSFAAGPRLLADGTPLKLVTPQKPKRPAPRTEQSLADRTTEAVE